MQFRAVLLACAFTLGCSAGPASAPEVAPDTGAVVPTDTGLAPTPDAAPLPDTAAPPADTAVADTPADSGPARLGTCKDPAPEGSPAPAPLAKYSAGVCPKLVPGANTLSSGGAARKFLLVLPKDFDPTKEKLPLIVMWHHLGGAADSLLSNGEVQAHADRLRFAAILPEQKGDLGVSLFGKTIDFAWPYLVTASDARYAEELTFFDDLLACVAEQVTIDRNCVSSVGVSAGALWTAQLLQKRSEVLASAVIMSGGTGPGAASFLDVRGWSGASHALPVLVGWGGPTDQCAANFDKASKTLESKLGANGDFLVECVHNCGHGAPPVDDPAKGLAVLYQFALDHPFWLSKGASPWQAGGMPADMPTWCAIGAGKATPRTGSCAATKSCPVPGL